MSDDEDELKDKVKEVLKEKDGKAALDLLTDDDAYNIPKNDRNRLGALAINDAYVAPYYTKIAGLLSGDVVKKLSEDLGRYGTADAILEVLEDSDYRQYHTAIISAAIANENIEITKLYSLAINSVSNETKDSLTTALGRDVNVSNEDLVEIIGDSQFAAQRPHILKHIEARMDADDLREFFEEAESILTPQEIVRLESAIERKKKYGHESEEHSDGSSDGSSGGGIGIALLLIAVFLLFALSRGYPPFL